ncbi:MAG: universal stress protein [Proteobacteria bacterium]|nr:universal stress protein [Pseudomonadota bacterium]
MNARSEPRGRAGRSKPAPLARVLVGTDFSIASNRALERAARLAAPGGEVHLLHVEDPAAPAAVRDEARRALASATADILKLARQSGGRRLRVTSSLRLGAAYVEIIRCARETGAELVVLGRGGSAAPRGRVIGATAARVMRMSDVPTLLVGSRTRGPYRRPLIAVELDPSARDLMELARRVVSSDEVPLRIIHVYRVPFESYYLANRERSAAGYFREVRKAAAASLAALLDSIGSRRYLVHPVLLRGNARSAIPREAARCHADLVVVGTHARSGVSHALLGSVAESVIENTSRDVLVARPVRFTFIPP